MIRMSYDEQDMCFAYSKEVVPEEEGFKAKRECACMNRLHWACRSPRCPFFKPVGLDDWYRQDVEGGIMLFPKEEVRVLDLELWKKNQ